MLTMELSECLLFVVTLRYNAARYTAGTHADKDGGNHVVSRSTAVDDAHTVNMSADHDLQYGTFSHAAG